MGPNENPGSANALNEDSVMEATVKDDGSVIQPDETDSKGHEDPASEEEEEDDT